MLAAALHSPEPHRQGHRKYIRDPALLRIPAMQQERRLELCQRSKRSIDEQESDIEVSWNLLNPHIIHAGKAEENVMKQMSQMYVCHRLTQQDEKLQEHVGGL